MLDDFKVPKPKIKLEDIKAKLDIMPDKPEPKPVEVVEKIESKSDIVIPKEEDMAKPVKSNKDFKGHKKWVKRVFPNPKYYIAKFKSYSKKKKALVIFIILLLLAGIGAGVYFGVIRKINARNGQTITQNAKAEEPAKPVTAPSPLTGVVVPIELTKRPVTAIMIENSTDARPQSGLESAGIVFEAIAEGGITRFITLFQEAQPSYIGPVRSLRPYYIDFAKPFDGGIAHVGGSPDALTQIRAAGMKDLDQFFNGNSFSRITQRDAPHNVYTDFTRLDALNTSKGFTSSTFTPWDRKKDEPTSSPTAKTIDINMSSYSYNVHYVYDATKNSYLRSEGGAPHLSIVSAKDPGTQLEPKVVVALVMSFSIVDSSGHGGYGTTGTGTAYFFQDGGVTVGTWSKASRNDQFKFLDGGDKPMLLNAGQTWVTIAKTTADVTYTQQ